MNTNSNAPVGMPKTFEEFKEFRRHLNKTLKLYLKGTLVWDSGPSWKRFRGLGLIGPDGEPLSDGELPRGKTYIKAKHGDLPSRTTAARSEPEPAGVPVE